MNEQRDGASWQGSVDSRCPVENRDGNAGACVLTQGRYLHMSTIFSADRYRYPLTSEIRNIPRQNSSMLDKCETPRKNLARYSLLLRKCAKPIFRPACN